MGSLPGVVLHDIDQLEATLDRNLSRRFAAVPKVEEIVAIGDPGGDGLAPRPGSDRSGR